MIIIFRSAYVCEFALFVELCYMFIVKCRLSQNTYDANHVFKSGHPLVTYDIHLR